MEAFKRARQLIRDFKGDRYLFGFGVLEQIGQLAQPLGRRCVLVRDTFPGSDRYVERLLKSLQSAGIEVARVVAGARPNTPREDVLRLAEAFRQVEPDLLVSFGGGSTIDATKAAEVLHTLGGDLEEYFGTGLVTAKLRREGKHLAPHLAIQTAASSAAHLTKYSNVTDLSTGQKKLIVDDAIVPERAAFDYEVTLEAPWDLTADGALDGVSHSLEVLYGAVGKPYYARMEEIAERTFQLVFQWLPKLWTDRQDRTAREALALATDLGGYAIMLGGTNGAHLTSFSLIDILSHGRACILMNPYYTVFYSPAIQDPLRLVARQLVENRLAPTSIERLRGRDLSEAVGEGLRELERRVQLPVRLADVPGFHQGHIDRALRAAKNPQLRMKLENMPVPLTPEMVDEYMGPVLEAAKTGDFRLIKNVPLTS